MAYILQINQNHKWPSSSACDYKQVYESAGHSHPKMTSVAESDYLG